MKLKELITFLSALDGEVDVQYSNEYTSCGVKLVLDYKKETLYFAGPMEDWDEKNTEVLLEDRD